MARPRKVDISAGKRHGHLTVVREVDPDRRGIARFQCLCDCGKTVTLRINHFYPSRRFCSQSCAFLSSQRIVDLVGKRFGRWTVLSSAGSLRRSQWNCKCDCGTERVVAGPSLTAGQTLSCGCLLGDLKRKGRTQEELAAAKRDNARRSACKHSARRKAHKIKYETKRAHATPPWLSRADWEQMDRIYAKARHLTAISGVRHEVDHEFPIQGKTVSGLHVPWNLQILTQAANVSKSNRYAGLYGDVEK